MKNVTISFGVLVLAGVVSGCSSGPESVVKDFYAAAEKGEVSKMVELVDLSSPQAQMMEGKIKTSMRDASIKISRSGIKELKVKCEEKAEFATCKVDMTLNSGGVGERGSEIKLSKKDGKWKLNIFGV